MSMNSHVRRRGRDQNEETQTGVENTETRAVEPDDEVTEITVRVRPQENRSAESSQDFNIHQLRHQEQLKSVKMEALVKGYVDPKGRRTGPRFQVELTTVIYTRQRSFRTGTVNVSMGGALLDNELPADFLFAELEILFIYEDAKTLKKKYFMIQGQALDNKRLQFKSASPTAQAALAEMMEQLKSQPAA